MAMRDFGLQIVLPFRSHLPNTAVIVIGAPLIGLDFGLAYFDHWTVAKNN